MGQQVAWFFGDVFLLHPSDPAKHYVGAISNAALLVPRGQAPALRRYRFVTDPTSGLARQVLPNRPDEGTDIRLWQLAGWYAPSDKCAYLYYAKVQTTGAGPLDFRVLGHGLARSDMRRPLAMHFDRVAGAANGLWWEPPAALYGVALIEPEHPKDPFLYVVGVLEVSGAKRATLARVLRLHIADMDSYEYLAGPSQRPRWSRRAEDAVPVTGIENFPTELSVAYNRYLGGYLAVHSVGLSERIRLSVAPEPWGPYQRLDEIGAPHRAFEKAFCYAGKEHPELTEEGGRVIYITYVDSQRYWLQLLRVTLL